MTGRVIATRAPPQAVSRARRAFAWRAAERSASSRSSSSSIWRTNPRTCCISSFPRPPITARPAAAGPPVRRVSTVHWNRSSRVATSASRESSRRCCAGLSAVRARSPLRRLLYVITGDTSYLAPYRFARATLSSRLRGLRALTADNPAQQRRLDSLDALVATRLERFQWTFETRRTGGPAAAGRAVIGGRGKELMQQVRGLVRQMEDDEERLLAERSAALQAKARLARFTAWGGGLVAVTLAVIAGGLITRSEE